MLVAAAHPSERWCTPPEIWEPLHAEFGFDLDAFADAETHRVPNYLTDALGPDPWPGNVIWGNPPYGRKLGPCVERFADEVRGRVGVMLIPFRCRAAWWHNAIIGRAAEVRCVRKRIRFLRTDGTRGKFTGSCDSCVVVWRRERASQTLLVAA